MPTDSSSKKPLAFAIRFVLLLALLYVPLTLDPVDGGVIQPFSSWIALVSGAVLNLIGQGVSVQGARIFTGMHGVSIHNGCNGIEATVFLLAATLAFPAPWRWRLKGALAGIFLIQVLNLIRVVALFLLRVHDPRLFELFHLALFQTIIGGATIAFFYVWSRRASAIEGAHLS